MRDGLNLGKYGYSVNVSAIIAAIDPNKCDTPLLDWCLRKGHWTPEDHNKKCVRAREAQKNLDEEFRRRTRRLSIKKTGMRDADVVCGTMWVSPHPLLASHQHHCDGTTLHHDMISCVQDEWICIRLHIPTTMTFRIFMDGTTTSWMIPFHYIYYSWYLEWL